MRSPDTTPEAHAAQLAAFRRMSPADRLRRALELSELTRELGRCRIRREHPNDDEAAVGRRLMRLLYGTEVPGAFR